MHDQASPLSQSATRLLMEAALEIPLSDLKALVSNSIQHGPAIHLSGPLTRVDQATIPPNCWEALFDFTGWGAGVIVQNSSAHSAHLLASTVHLDCVLRAIAKHLESDSGQSEQQAKLEHQKRPPLIKQPRKHDDSPELV